MLAPLRISLVLLLICGGVYPTLVTLVGGVAFPYQANGTIINGKEDNPVGSELIAQAFDKDQYFHPRPSAAGADGWDAPEGFFRAETLTALRELTLRRMALHTQRKLEQSGETVLVCVLRGDEAQVLVRRGLHLADRLRSKLIVLHISEPAGGLQPDPSGGHQETVKALQLARALGAEVHTLVAPSSARVSEMLVQFATSVGASQIVHIVRRADR